MKSITISMLFIATIYATLSIAAMFLFGKKLGQSILINVGMKYEDDKIYWEAYAMQVFFLVILACHIPYLYFSGKESILIIIDEIMRGSTS